MEDYLTGSLLVFIAGIFIIPFLPGNKKGLAAFISVLGIALISSVPAVYSLVNGNTITLHLYLPYPFGEIPIRVDPLAAWFMLIINVTCIHGSWYGMGYMKPYEDQNGNCTMHWILFLVFQVSMLCVCVLQSSLAFLVAWEIMSVSSFLLVLFDHTKTENLKAGVNYLVQMHIGVSLLTCAFLWVYIKEGSFDFAAIGTYFEGNDPFRLFVLFFIGFGIKAGFIPLHTWLPHAHPAAPSHVSGVMSGVIVKLGIYGILRMITYLHSSYIHIGEDILILSMITAFYGILNASVHRDFKRMLAFCTIENIGIIGMAIGVGLIGKATGNVYMFFIGFAGALLHILNHSLYKSLLFFTAGNIYSQTHTRDMEQLGGLIKKMPQTAFFFLCGSLAIGALPPFNGFISELLIYTGLVEGIKASNVEFNLLMIISIAALAMIGGISMLTFTKSFGVIFLGTPRKDLEHEPTEVSLSMRLPLYVIVALMLSIGLFPNFVLYTLLPVIRVFDPLFQSSDSVASLLQVLTTTGRVSMALIALISSIFYIRTKLTKHSTKSVSATWGCGYGAPLPSMQYTGKSFSKTLAKLFKVFIIEEKKYHEIETDSIFPVPRNFKSHYAEFFEIKIIDKFNTLLFRFMNKFTFIHNGQTQMYLLYGVFFIILLLIASFLNIF